MLISIAQAKQGMILSEDILSDNNIKLLASGTPLTDTIIKVLEEKGYDTLNISITENEKKMWGITEDFFYPTINQKIINSAKELLALLNTPQGYQRLNNESIKRIIHVSQIITSKILASDSKYIYYLNDYAKNKDLISQSVRVATYATVLAKAYNADAEAKGQSKINLEEIATAGLLHNFGSICADEGIRKSLNYYLPLSGNFPGLSLEKVKALKANYDAEYIPYYSYNLLYDRKDISTFVKTVVVLSRETENEKGPLKAKQFTLPVYDKSLTMNAAKIISLCRMFDDILVTNIDKDITLENTQAALGALFKVNYYNENLINLLTNNIPLYPVGTKVILEGIHNGVGVVVDNYTDLHTWHRPSVKLLDTDEIIDLRIENATVISHLCDDIVEANKVIDNLDDGKEETVSVEPVQESTKINESIPEETVTATVVPEEPVNATVAPEEPVNATVAPEENISTPVEEAPKPLEQVVSLEAASKIPLEPIIPVEEPKNDLNVKPESVVKQESIVQPSVTPTEPVEVSTPAAVEEPPVEITIVPETITENLQPQPVFISEEGIIESIPPVESKPLEPAVPQISSIPEVPDAEDQVVRQLSQLNNYPQNIDATRPQVDSSINIFPDVDEEQLAQNQQVIELASGPAAIFGASNYPPQDEIREPVRMRM